MDNEHNSGQGFTQFIERVRDRFTRNVEEDRYGREDGPRGRAITICVLISMTLWFLITMQESYTVMLSFPTEVVNVPSDRALTSLPPEEVRAQVRGQGFSLLQLRYQPPRIPISAAAGRVELRDAVPEELQNRVQIQGFSPQVVELAQGPRVTRKVPVRLRANIETPETYELIDPPRVEPDSVAVTGAKSIVNNIRYWPTQSFSYDGLRDTLVASVPLADTLSRLVTTDVEAVTMQAVAGMFTEGTREIRVDVQGAPTRDDMKVVTLEQETVRVRYNVLFSQYEEAREAPDFFATVTYEQIRADTTGRVRPIAQEPEDLVLRDVEMIPPTLRYYNVLVDE